MPNGGIHPSCFVCKWASKDSPEGGTLESIVCQYHGFVVWQPASHFCAQLSGKQGEFAQFVQAQHIDTEQMYAWIDLQYRTTEHPQIPQYHHEIVPLTDLSTYKVWNDEEKQVRYRDLHRQCQQAFAQKVNES